MDRYGTDYNTRGTWNRGMNQDYGRGMDRGFEWGEGRGNFGRWTTRDRGWGGSSYDEGWRSMNRGREFGGYNTGGYGTGGYHPGYGSFGAQGGYGGQGYETGNRGFYDRDMYGTRDRWETGRGRWDTNQDQGFGDRLRHGWNRMRNEARDWMGGRGQGYDRGW